MAERTVRLYDTLPEIIRADDLDMALSKFFGAVERQLSRTRDEHTDIALAIGPETINANVIEQGTLLAATANTATLPVGSSPFAYFYRNRWIRITKGTGKTTQPQTRRIIDYDAATQIVTLEKDWQVTPDATSEFVILNTFVDLNYLAHMVGIDLDQEDEEELQREQILNAISFYKLKGTKRGFLLLFKTFGFDAELTELYSNYEHAPQNIPGVCDPEQIHFSEGNTTIPAQIFNICEYLTANPDLQIPDSDLRVLLARRHPEVVLTVEKIRRMLRRIEDIRPAHVEIPEIGMLEVLREDVEPTGLLTIEQQSCDFDGYYDEEGSTYDEPGAFLYYDLCVEGPSIIVFSG